MDVPIADVALPRQHLLYFFPEPQGQGSFLPILRDGIRPPGPPARLIRMIPLPIAFISLGFAQK